MRCCSYLWWWSGILLALNHLRFLPTACGHCCWWMASLAPCSRNSSGYGGFVARSLFVWQMVYTIQRTQGIWLWSFLSLSTYRRFQTSLVFVMWFVLIILPGCSLVPRMAWEWEAEEQEGLGVLKISGVCKVDVGGLGEVVGSFIHAHCLPPLFFASCNFGKDAEEFSETTNNINKDAIVYLWYN